jgi:uncharacterized protein (TIGR02246 family)
MRRLLPLLATLSLMGCATSTGRFDAAQPSEELRIRSVLEQMQEVWNRHDMDAFSNLFTEDADFVNVIGTHWRGPTAIRDALQREHATIFLNSHFEIRETTVRFLRKDIAIARSVWDLTGQTTKTGEAAPARSGVLTNVFLKSGSTWKIVAAQNTNIVRPAG